MTAYFVCTKIPVKAGPLAGYVPGKLVQSTDPTYKALVAMGVLLWPSTDASVASAANIAQGFHKNKGHDEDVLQSTMLAGVATSLAAGGGIGGGGGSAAPVSGALGTLPTATQALTVNIAAANATAALPTTGLFNGLTYDVTVTAGANPGAFSFVLTGAANSMDAPLSGPGLTGAIVVLNTSRFQITYNSTLGYWVQT